MKGFVEARNPIAPTQWLDAGIKLIALMQDDTDLLIDLERSVAVRKLDIMRNQDKRNVAAAELEVQTTDEWVSMRKQTAKVERINQFIMMSKKYATIKEGDFR